jgi:hypothetical protein
LFGWDGIDTVRVDYEEGGNQKQQTKCHTIEVSTTIYIRNFNSILNFSVAKGIDMIPTLNDAWMLL